MADHCNDELQWSAERDQLVAEKAELQDRLLRGRAEFDNFRKRTERERSDYIQYAAMEMVRELLPILDDFERAQLADLGKRADWIWISGNHDPALPQWLSGRIAEEVAIGNLVFRHEPSDYTGRGEIAGHLHPCKTVNRRGQSLRRRCFASDGLRLVMPSFGAYTGGLDVRDSALRSLFPKDFLAYVLGRARVYAVAA